MPHSNQNRPHIWYRATIKLTFQPWQERFNRLKISSRCTQNTLSLNWRNCFCMCALVHFAYHSISHFNEWMPAFCIYFRRIKMWIYSAAINSIVHSNTFLRITDERNFMTQPKHFTRNKRQPLNLTQMLFEIHLWTILMCFSIERIRSHNIFSYMRWQHAQIRHFHSALKKRLSENWQQSGHKNLFSIIE